MKVGVRYHNGPGGWKGAAEMGFAKSAEKNMDSEMKQLITFWNIMSDWIIHSWTSNVLYDVKDWTAKYNFLFFL